MTSTSIDWAALYQRHRAAMYGVAHVVLRSSGRTDLAEDAINDAMVSLMNSPPTELPRNWEALLVVTAKRRALDMIKSAAMTRGVTYSEEHMPAAVLTEEDDSLERLERIARARPVVARLDPQAHAVLGQYIVLDRPRADVAAELGVSPGRVSQIAKKVLSEISAAVKEGG